MIEGKAIGGSSFSTAPHWPTSLHNRLVNEHHVYEYKEVVEAVVPGVGSIRAAQ
jgi:hypothetical protein